MTLRTVHLIFMLFAIIAAEMFGAWAFYNHAATGNPQLLWLGTLGLLGGLALAGYALFFVRRADNMGIE